ncbi:MAG: TraR/DksA family transcriptional regulator [Desulfoarculaceae bacterium]|nr:TraR/DksA family transcriptional regulator [Desulfoarculaceae bacterium]
MPDDRDIAYYKKRLEERLAVIMAGKAAKNGEGPVKLDQTSVGRLSRMDAMQQQAMAEAADRLTDFERQRIGAAFKRIESGDYGCCVVCGEEIAEGRLRFDPSVLMCISCAQKAEGK